ncbi:hypothetical protein BPUTSESOX_3 [uncultured Gammaproteobacteria bacterium]|nr:hypothetical protein BPUTSESOX_3 [uncultured Gammaproteobacteria bacterium]
MISLNLVLASLKNRQVGEKWVFDDCSYLSTGETTHCKGL